jgi:hypothetical protein
LASRIHHYDLWKSLDIEQASAAADSPPPTNPDRAEFLWNELMDSTPEDVRLDPNLRSFFVVNEIRGAVPQSLYVSADWPSAESFAKNLLTRASLHRRESV